MNTLSNIKPFPVPALPDILRDAVYEVQRNIQAPLPLIVASALSACSLACQHAFNVKRPTGQESPVSLFFLTMAESGERKSTVDNLFTGPIRNYQEREAEKYRLAISEYKPAFQAWEAEYKGIKAMIEKLSGKGESTESHKQRLIEVAAKEPVKPRLIKLLYDDTTPEALKFGLYENSQSIALWSDEAGSIFNGRGLSELALLNKLWDGGAITVDRRSSESFTIRDARMTIALMVQEPVLKQYLERKGEEARGIGFFARVLVAAPASTQGTRFIQYAQTSWQYLPVFQERLASILEQGSQFSGSSAERICLTLSVDAQARWLEAYNHIESYLPPGGYLSDVKDFAAKLADNIARLAALFHWVDGHQGEISLDAVSRAIDIMYWYADEFVRLFAADHVPEDVRDAEMLSDWLVKLYQVRGWICIKKNYIRQYGPNSLRSRDRMDAALDVLCGWRRVWFTVGAGKTKFVNVDQFWLNGVVSPLPQLGGFSSGRFATF